MSGNVLKMICACPETPLNTSEIHQITFVIYNCFPNYDRKQLVQELLAIHNKMVGTDAMKKGEPHWTEVLTDVLLGFLAQPSQLWRTLSKETYRHISSHLTNEALWLIIKVPPYS